METLGYIVYGILCLMALYYMLGVRLKADATIFTILTSLFLTAFAILIPVLEMDYLNSLWVIPAGIILSFLIAHLYGRFGIQIPLLRNLTGVYALILRIGLSDKSDNPFLDSAKLQMRKEVEETTRKDTSHLEDDEVRDLYVFGKEEEERIQDIKNKILK